MLRERTCRARLKLLAAGIVEHLVPQIAGRRIGSRANSTSRPGGGHRPRATRTGQPDGGFSYRNRPLRVSDRRIPGASRIALPLRRKTSDKTASRNSRRGGNDRLTDAWRSVVARLPSGRPASPIWKLNSRTGNGRWPSSTTRPPAARSASVLASIAWTTKMPEGSPARAAGKHPIVPVVLQLLV